MGDSLPSYDELVNQTKGSVPSYEELMGQKSSAPTSAKAAFEAGNPNARMISDSGDVTYANPVSGSAALASGVLKGAMSVPFAGNLAGRAIAGATGQSNQDFSNFQAAAEEQHPLLSAAGELGGVLGLGPKLYEAGGQALFQAGKSAASGIQSAISAVEGTALKAGSKLSGLLGANGLKKAIDIMSDAASAANPRVLRKSVEQMGSALESVGSDLAKDYSTVEKVLPSEAHYTIGELRAATQQKIIAEAQSNGEALTGDFMSNLSDEINNTIPGSPDDLIKTNKIWKTAQKAETRAGVFKTGKVIPKNENTVDVLDRIRQSLRSTLEDQATQATTLGEDKNLLNSIQSKSDLYGQIKKGEILQTAKLRTASKPEVIQNAANKTAEVLALGPDKLGKYYNILTRALTRGLPAAGLIYSNLLHDDPKFRELINSNGGN
jgi:hypothetical protein